MPSSVQPDPSNLRKFAACVSILLLIAMVAPGYAQDRASPLDTDRVGFVLGNVEFALLHELAHLVIGEMDLPIIGPEEQAADYLATMSLLRPLEIPPVGSERWLEFALTTADAFVILWQLGEKTGAVFPYWDSHALSIQRFYTIGCLLYGSSPDRFSAVPGLIEMPARRAESCAAEYARAARSIDWFLEAFGRKEGEPQKRVMTVRFEAPHSRISEYLVREIQAAGLIDWTLQRLEELINLNADATVVLRSCSMPEAAWIPEQRELVFCYELLDLYYALSSAQDQHEIRSLLTRD